MKHSIKMGPLCIGAFLACVTGYCLFNDVLAGAPVTTAHALTMAALVVALAAFHMVPRAGFLSAVVLIVLGLSATAYIVISSGSRNAETAQVKASAIEARNSIRARASDSLSRAEDDLRDARAEMAKECASGHGIRCKGTEETVKAQEASVAAARGVLDASPPSLDAEAGLAQTARVIAAIAGGNADSIETKLELALPFLVVLIVELGTITFLHIGLGTPTNVEVPRVEPVELTRVSANDDGPDGGSTGEVVSWVREFRARHGRNPQIPELQARFQAVPKTTAWRRIKSA